MFNLLQQWETIDKRIEEIFITNFLIGRFDGLNEKEFVFSVVKPFIGKWNTQVGTDH